MRKGFIIIILGIFGCVFASAQKFEFKEENIDYGQIKKGRNGERIFEFKNIGDKPLILSNISASCGCTTPKWSTHPIAPNQTGTIAVKYDTQRLGKFRREISVYSNALKEGRKVIWIQGEVIE